MMNPQQAFDMEDMEGDCLTAALEEFSCMMANLSDPRRKTEVILKKTNIFVKHPL
jgi:hypothetical protein